MTEFCWFRCWFVTYGHEPRVYFHRTGGDQCPEGWHSSEEAARKAVAAEMRQQAATIADPHDRLRNALLREAQSVTRDDRSRGS